ncbi:amino acid racemase [Irregularibacter muris]|uniref:Amino acid racemase n=1 Tax=Irregularibacter muris TaxID=1796619 RepID=A0AAE3HGY7_9FIRM|nr:amino acid racemase [Irregularibacter muris]MCR1899302.1 amino acid racemase [Irregularibacter muris]
MNDKIIGIIGGMGPEATADLYMKIIKATKVKKDQDHFRVIIDSNAKIPDRTKAILGIGQSPVDALVETGKNLEKSDVDIACLPCITSHYFIDEIQEKLSYPIMNALVEVGKYIEHDYPHVKNVGILATSGTVKTGLFSKYLPNMNVLYPDSTTQVQKVMEAIYGDEGIKNGNTGDKPLNLLKEASMELMDKGAELIISGCTEIALALKPHHLSRPLIDPMMVVANAITK